MVIIAFDYAPFRPDLILFHDISAVLRPKVHQSCSDFLILFFAWKAKTTGDRFRLVLFIASFWLQFQSLIFSAVSSFLSHWVKCVWDSPNNFSKFEALGVSSWKIPDSIINRFFFISPDVFGTDMLDSM